MIYLFTHYIPHVEAAFNRPIHCQGRGSLGPGMSEEVSTELLFHEKHCMACLAFIPLFTAVSAWKLGSSSGDSAAPEKGAQQPTLPLQLAMAKRVVVGSLELLHDSMALAVC